MNSFEMAAAFGLIEGVLKSDVRMIYGMIGCLVLSLLVRWKKKQLKRLWKKIRKLFRKLYNSKKRHRQKKKKAHRQG